MGQGARSAVLAGVFAAACAFAQEGFPLDGTWRGEWIGEGGRLEPVVIVMRWDGEQVNGTINPGRNAFQFSSGVLDPTDWSVHIEATAGDSRQIRIEGKLRDIGSYRRFIEGAWIVDGVVHGFKVVRE